MHALKLKSVVAATLLATSLAALPAHAEDLYAGGLLASPRYAQRVDALPGNAPKPSLGVQYSLASDIALRGGLDRSQPDILGDRPNIAQYRFGLRISF